MGVTIKRNQNKIFVSGFSSRLVPLIFFPISLFISCGSGKSSI